jgi:CheY-like chemotaxis protein
MLNAAEAQARAVVQIDGHALRAPTARVLDWLGQSPALASLVGEHVSHLFLQARQNALCHGLHSIESRFVRWLLEASDRAGDTKLELTQESCAQLLGVQRTTLSMVAHSLQLAGMLRTRRGSIQILNRPALLQRTCVCYAKVKPQLGVGAVRSVEILARATGSSSLHRIPGLTLLVVDDDGAFAYAVRRYFEGNGFRVITASGSSQALDIMAKSDFHAVITDVKLSTGEPDGVELASRIRGKHPNIPLMLVTAYPELLKGRPVPGDKIFLKPVEISQLCRAVEAGLAA